MQHNRVSANNNFCPNFEGFLPDLSGGGIVIAGLQHAKAMRATRRERRPPLFASVLGTRSRSK